MAESVEADRQHGKHTECSRDILDTYVRLFLKGEALQRMIVQFCSGNHKGDSMQPIISCISAMLRNPINLAFNEAGILPFKNTNEYVFLYSAMTDEQRKWLVEICDNNALPMEVSKYTGDSLFLRYNCTTIRYLDKEEVILNLCRLLTTKRIHEDQKVRMALIKIIMQKLMTVVNVSSDIVRNVYTTLKTECGIAGDEDECMEV